MTDSNWQLVSSDSLRKFHVVDILENIFEFRPTGEQRSYVACDSADWVLVIPVTTEDDIVFVRQFRHGIAQQVLEIPGGIIDPGETPTQTAIRELAEETGYVAQSIKIFVPLYPNPALNTARIHVAVATGCSQTLEPHPEPHEDIEIELRRRSSVSRMIASGELQHALCVAAFAITGVHESESHPASSQSSLTE